MKIIIVNYRYFITGGPERYMFNVIDLLKNRGHEVIPFSVKHNSNVPSAYESYFVSPLGKGDVTYFGESSKSSIKEMLELFFRMFYSFEAKRKFRQLVIDTKPDLVYILHYQNKLSPSFIGVAKRFKLPVVQRISDYGHICANQIFYNYRFSSACELCLHGSLINAVKYKCVYDSALYSFIKIAALYFHRLIGIIKKIDVFIIPSRFTISKYSDFGIPETKLIHIPSFFRFSNNSGNNLTRNISNDDFALYIGRLEEEKGIMTLVKAFEDTGMRLIIIGDSANGYDSVIKQYLQGKTHKIEFLGRQSFGKVKEYLSRCAFTICPSECYDNFPNSIVESFAFSKAVISTNLGSLRELVEHNVTGLLFEPKDHIKLREYSSFLFGNREESIRMGKKGKEMINNFLSENNHYNSLISVFNDLITKTGKKVQDRYIEGPIDTNNSLQIQG